jgi:hypothetical protein
MFKEISQCMATVDELYFGLFHPFEYSPLPLYFPPSVSQNLSVHILISYTFTFYGMWYYCCFIILLSFTFFLKFHRLVNTVINIFYNWACMWSCLFLYICLSLDISSMYERKHVSFVFLIMANFIYHDVLQLYPFTFKPHVIIPCGWVILNCVYIQ